MQIPEHKLEQWGPLVSLIVQQFLRHFEQRAEGNTVPILFLLDEFPRLGKMEAIIHGLATLRSKKITIMPIVQSLAQLDATYGKEQRQIICDNCSYKAILKATDADTQKYFSSLVGTEEQMKYSYELRPRGSLVFDLLNMAAGKSPQSGGGKTSVTTEEKPIIKPEDFAYLTDIVLLTPYGFTRVKQHRYYEPEGSV